MAIPKTEKPLTPYLVWNTESGHKTIVKAQSAAAALAHIVRPKFVRPKFTVSKPTYQEVLELMSVGITVETVGIDASETE